MYKEWKKAEYLNIYYTQDDQDDAILADIRKNCWINLDMQQDEKPTA